MKVEKWMRKRIIKWNKRGMRIIRHRKMGPDYL